MRIKYIINEYEIYKKILHYVAVTKWKRYIYIIIIIWQCSASTRHYFGKKTVNLNIFLFGVLT